MTSGRTFTKICFPSFPQILPENVVVEFSPPSRVLVVLLELRPGSVRRGRTAKSQDSVLGFRACLGLSVRVWVGGGGGAWAKCRCPTRPANPTCLAASLAPHLPSCPTCAYPALPTPRVPEQRPDFVGTLCFGEVVHQQLAALWGQVACTLSFSVPFSQLTA